MSAHRPIAYRAFTVLLAFLLVGSLVAPIAATQPAAAQDGDTINVEEDCGAFAKFAFPRSCHAAEALVGDIDESADATTVKIDVHTSAQGVYEGAEQIDSVYQNYLQDTETLASLEARNAIADAYENNKTAIEAQAAGQQAINQYYAQHQRQSLEALSADSQELAYLSNVSQNHDGVDNSFLHLSGIDQQSGSLDSTQLTGDTQTSNYTLANGSEYQYRLPEVRVQGTVEYNSIDKNTTLSFDKYNENKSAFEFEAATDVSPPDYVRVDFAGTYHVLSVTEANLTSQGVYDQRMTLDRLQEIDEQAATVQQNYDENAAEDLYAAMDSGQISPNDVRGAEGMVRYMSGDGNVTEDRFNYALRSTLNLASSDLDSTMVVDFEGATERSRVVDESTGNYSYTYNSVNETYEGLLFSSETPEGGFVTDTRYSVDEFNGSISMVADGGSSQVDFYRGNFTITEMYDSDGNAVNQTDWSDPKYDSYNSTEFINALEKAAEERAALAEEDDSDGSIGIPNPFDGGLGSGGSFVGLAIIGVVLVVVVGFVTDMIPGVGK